MIDLYTWNTPNGRKVSIMLEETGLPYAVRPVRIDEGEQFAPDFLAISPSGRIPAIVDRDTGTSLMESGAILLYLAEKSGRFLPRDPAERWRTMEWLMYQMGSVGPFLGQVHHFHRKNPGLSPPAEERFRKEAERIYATLDRRLGESAHLAGADYGVADVATWPWIARHDWQSMDLNRFANLRRWYLAIAARPAVQRGYHVPARVQEIPMPG